MAVMSDTDRQRAWIYMLRMLADEDWGALTKGDLRAALDAADTWADSNAAAFNAALPQPFRGAATVGMKNRLLAAVCLRRAGRAKVAEDS